MKKKHSIIFIFIFLCRLSALCQYIEEQVSAFSSRTVNPVTVDVRTNRNDLTFFAENLSYYPYHLEIQFTSFVNLSPVMNNFKTDIYHGRTDLFKLTVADIGSFHDYSYNVQYTIGYSDRKISMAYPYSIPLSEGKTIRLWQVIGNKDTTFFRNAFMVNAGDTIFCIRKGIVTNTFATGDKYDRILKSGNLEIIHADNTVAAYSIPGEEKILVVPGQQVYPLQPIMVLKNPGKLIIQMCQIRDSSVKSIDFTFEQEDRKSGNLDGKVVRHSLISTQIELTDKEKKKLAKGNLF